MNQESRHLRISAALAAVAALFVLLTPPVGAQQSVLLHEPYRLDTGLITRSISFENPTGASGAGGKEASNLGPGRKGSPSRTVEPGQTVPMCDIEGPGTIRHMWVTTLHDPAALRSFVVRAYYDGQEHPSIECPLGDFFGTAHGKVMPYHSAVHSVGPSAGMNIWLPMPFVKRVRMTFTNEGDKATPFFYQITYTLRDKHPLDVGRLHVLFRRENPTTEKRDFELLPLRKQKGRFIGSVIGVRNLHPDQWWGEGEIKVFMDGDREFPTIVGTGSEDYVGLSWGMQQTPFLYNGCSLNQVNELMNGQMFVSMYRWHLPDPIAWRTEARITIQQIAWKDGLHETQDDWSAATFWYEPVPSAQLPAMPGVTARTREIWKNPEKK